MWKILAALLFGIATVVMPVYGGGRNAASQVTQDSSRTPPSSELPVANIDSVTHYPQDREKEHQEWKKLIELPNGLTSWAIIFTLIAIVWQSNETRKAAKASMMSAAAANRSADTYVSKERARVVLRANNMAVEYRKDRLYWHIAMTLIVENIGLSRAYVRNKQITLCIQKADYVQPRCEAEKLWLIGLMNDTIEPSRPITSTLSFYELDGTPEQLVESVNEGKSVARLSGFLEYETMGEVWRRDFNYVYSLTSFRDLIGRAKWSAENALLLGTWLKDPELPNGEQKQNAT